MHMILLEDHVRDMKKMLVEDYGLNSVEVEKAIPEIKRVVILTPLAQPDFQMLFLRHAQTRKARPDVKRFVQDLLGRVTDHAERDRARARIRKQRSRLKQSGQIHDGSIQVGLGNGSGVNELNT
jgi:hypothetical protein